LDHIGVWLRSLHWFRKRLNLSESFIIESLLSDLNSLLISIQVEKLVIVYWWFIMTIRTLVNLLLHVFHVSFVHMMVSF